MIELFYFIIMALLFSLAIDVTLGELPTKIHPVVIIGSIISFFKKIFINIKNKELKNELSLYQLPKLSKEELKQQIQIYDNEVKAYAMLRNMQCIKSIKYEIYKKSDRYRDSVKYVQDSIKQYFLKNHRF